MRTSYKVITGCKLHGLTVDVWQEWSDGDDGLRPERSYQVDLTGDEQTFSGALSFNAGDIYLLVSHLKDVLGTVVDYDEHGVGAEPTTASR